MQLLSQQQDFHVFFIVCHPVDFGNLSITNSYFEGNRAEGNGGAIVINGNYLNTVVLSNNIFAYNSALNGGAIYYDFDGVFPTITGNTYEDNYVEENGGALYIAYGGVTETGSAFHSNTAYGEGGAIYSTSDAPSQITDGEIMGNSSPMVVAMGSGVLNVGRNLWDDIGGPAPGDVVGNVEFGGSQCEMTGDDLDGDCLANDFESLIPDLSPEMLDSDGDEDYDTDRLSNLAEQDNGTDPTSWDTDRDDLSDGSEILDYFSDPHIADTDGDELPDGFEVYLSHTSPTLIDTDGDGVDDGAADQDNDGLTTLAEFIWESYPLAPDSNGNGILDGDEDVDGDGLTIAQELQCSTTPWDWVYDPTPYGTKNNHREE